MFNRSKSKNPVGFVADTLFDALLPKKQKLSRKKKALGLGLASAAVAAVGAAVTKNKEPK